MTGSYLRSAASVRLAAILVSTAVTAGCVQQLAVTPVAVQPRAEAARIPGKFVVAIGNFPLRLTAHLGQCGAYVYQADIGQLYADAVRAGFTNAFHDVDIRFGALPPEQLAVGGYVAEFAFDTTQQGARTQSIELGLGQTFSVSLLANMTRSDPSGVYPPVPLSANGTAVTHDMLFNTCGAIGDVISDSLHAALTQLVQKELDAARESLRVPTKAARVRPAF